jgi:hypothetical protein
MNQEEQAKELVDRFHEKIEHQDSHWDTYEDAKQCALICVRELIKEQTMWQNGQTDTVLHWQEVEQELLKIN